MTCDVDYSSMALSINSEPEAYQEHAHHTRSPPALMRMALELTEALPSIVKRKFEAAKASSDLVFSPTDLAIIRTSNGIPASNHANH